jgi:predicted Zn-dependent peptidase
MYNIVSLENGLRVVYEKIPHVRSVSAGIWVGTGSRNENLGNNGVSHFVEHMLFKGTRNRTAKDIAEAMDQIGGQINAFTGKECTCYYAKTLDTHLERVFDILSDMFFHSTFVPKDIEVEKKVILEEINMYEDTPEEMVHDLLTEISWKGHPLGFSILGTVESLSGLDQKRIKNYLKARYSPWNTVISVAGNFEEKALLDCVQAYFESWNKMGTTDKILKRAKFNPNTYYKEKDIEQMHVCIGFDSVENSSEDLYSLLALNNILGGGMSSRLFQKIREELGLVYSIYSYPSAYSNGGIFNIYAGKNPQYFEQVLKLIANELVLIKKQGVLKEELLKTKEQLKANYILGLESTSSRMNSIGKSLLLLNKVQTQEEILGKIDDITETSINKITHEVLNFKKVSMAVVGKVNQKVDFKDFLR